MQISEFFSPRVRVFIKNKKRQVVIIKQLVGAEIKHILPGGGVNSGESLIDALHREIREETGLFIRDPQLKIVREVIIGGYFRSHEYFFIADHQSGEPIIGIDPERGSLDQKIVGAEWVDINHLRQIDIKPDFVSNIGRNKSPYFQIDKLSLEEYIKIYKEVPISKHQASELVHVMLKPDAIENGLENDVIQDLLFLGGKLILQKRLKLNRQQVEQIYFDFTFDSAREYVFRYLTTNETLHLAFVGESGLHDKFNQAKGKTGSNQGLRGKYISQYIKLDKTAYGLWLQNKHPEQEVINAEMFCRNLLHIAPSADASKKGIEIIICCK